MTGLAVARNAANCSANFGPKPGTSAIFVLSSGAVMDKVKDAFAGEKPELLFTNLSNEQERALQEAFGE